MTKRIVVRIYFSDETTPATGGCLEEATPADSRFVY